MRWKESRKGSYQGGGRRGGWGKGSAARYYSNYGDTNKH